MINCVIIKILTHLTIHSENIGNKFTFETTYTFL